eukprot:6877558-Alexandrium_andersonii.AAC.1
MAKETAERALVVAKETMSHAELAKRQYEGAQQLTREAKGDRTEMDVTSERKREAEGGGDGSKRHRPHEPKAPVQAPPLQPHQLQQQQQQQAGTPQPGTPVRDLLAGGQGIVQAFAE